MKRKYREIYFTDHALGRLKDRGIKQGDVYATWNRPDESKFSKKKGAWIYTRDVGGNDLEVVAIKNDKGEWVVISVWSKPSDKSLTNDNKSLLRKFFDKLLSL